MLRNNFELSVLVNGNDVKEYEHEGMTFIEGKSGTEFTIKLRNNTWQRVMAVLTVDGKSVIDGAAGNVNLSPGYILEPHSTTNIPGWRINNENIAKFFFTKKESSYTAEAGSGIANVGIVGCAFFYEKQTWNYTSTYDNVWNNPYKKWEPAVYFTCGDVHIKNAGVTSVMDGGQVSANNTTLCGANGNLSAGASGFSTGTTCNANYVNQCDSNTRTIKCSNTSDNELGTGFGQKQYHAVQTIQFNRADSPTTVIELYYDTRDGLKAKGVPLQPRAKISGSAFPANEMVVTGCQPPKGWRG